MSATVADTRDAIPTVDEAREILDTLYPGVWSLALIAVCEPQQHEHGGAPCLHPGKRPLASDWNGASRERIAAGADRAEHLERAARHLARGGNVGLAIPLGVLALDADGGAEDAAKLAAALPDAPMQVTTRGAHFLVRCDLDLPAQAKVEILDGVRVDLRAGGKSQIVVDPSRHVSGALYSWRVELPERVEDLPELPHALYESLAALASPSRDWSEIAGGVPEGGRHDALKSLLARWRAKGATREELVDVAEGFAVRCTPPMDAGDVRGLVEWAAGLADAKGKLPHENRGNDETLPDQQSGKVAALSQPEPAPDAATFFGESGFVPARVGALLKAEAHLALGEDDRLYRYESGVHVSDGEAFTRARLRDLLGDKFKKRHLDEVLAWLRSEPPSIPARPPDRFINCRNGLLDWRTGELFPHTPTFPSAIQIPAEWHPHASCPSVEKFLCDVLPDEETVALVLEIIGYALLAELSLHTAVLLLGPGRNGKSVLLAILRALLGPANVASVPLQLFSESRFAAAALYGKLANVCGDLDARAIERTDVFKMMTGGDPIHAERKYGHPFAFTSFALPIFSANEAPYSKDQSEAWFERWLVIPMPKVIPPEKRDPHLAAKLTAEAELEGLLVRAVESLRRLMARGRFQIPTAVREAGRGYREEIDSVAGWLADRCDFRDPQAVTARADLYQSYRRWCDANGHRYPLRAEGVYSRLRAHPDLGETAHAGVREFKGVRIR